MARDRSQDGVVLVARVLIGVCQLLIPALIALAFAAKVDTFLATYGFETSQAAVRTLCFLLVIGGLMITAGPVCRKTSLVMIALLVGIAFWKVRFWEFSGYQLWVGRALFAHLLVGSGGLLLLLIIGPGRYALLSNERDWRELCPWLANWGALIGRLLVGAPLLWMAICQLVNWQATLDLLTVQGVPWPWFSGVVGVGLQLVGSALILAGRRYRAGVVLLIVYFVITSYLLQPIGIAVESQLVISTTDLNAYLLESFPSDHLLHARLVANQLGIIGSLLLVWTCPLGKYRLAH